MAVRVMVAPAITKGELDRNAAAPRAVEARPASKPKRRRSAVYDADGNEVLITLMCQKCHKMRPLSLFGLRKMSDGTIRNQPWCRSCRSGTGNGKARNEVAVEESPVPEESPAAAPSPQAAEPVAGQEPKRRNPAAEIAAALDAGRG